VPRKTSITLLGLVTKSRLSGIYLRELQYACEQTFIVTLIGISGHGLPCIGHRLSLVTVPVGHSCVLILRILLCLHFFPPASSAPVERAFSQSGLFAGPHRARISDNLLSATIRYDTMEYINVRLKADE